MVDSNHSFFLRVKPNIHKIPAKYANHKTHYNINSNLEWVSCRDYLNKGRVSGGLWLLFWAFCGLLLFQSRHETFCTLIVCIIKYNWKRVKIWPSQYFRSFFDSKDSCFVQSVFSVLNMGHFVHIIVEFHTWQRCSFVWFIDILCLR